MNDDSNWIRQDGPNGPLYYRLVGGRVEVLAHIKIDPETGVGRPVADPDIEATNERS